MDRLDFKVCSACIVGRCVLHGSVLKVRSAWIGESVRRGPVKTAFCWDQLRGLHGISEFSRTVWTSCPSNFSHGRPLSMSISFAVHQPRFEGPCEACDAFTLDSALLNQAGKCLNRHRDSACFTGLSSRRLLLPLFCSVGPCLDGASGPVLCRLAMLGWCFCLSSAPMVTLRWRFCFSSAPLDHVWAAASSRLLPIGLNAHSNL